MLEKHVQKKAACFDHLKQANKSEGKRFGSGTRTLLQPVKSSHLSCGEGKLKRVGKQSMRKRANCEGRDEQNIRGSLPRFQVAVEGSLGVSLEVHY